MVQSHWTHAVTTPPAAEQQTAVYDRVSWSAVRCSGWPSACLHVRLHPSLYGCVAVPLARSLASIHIWVRGSAACPGDHLLLACPSRLHHLGTATQGSTTATDCSTGVPALEASLKNMPVRPLPISPKSTCTAAHTTLAVTTQHEATRRR